jgi:hypothetical protein
MINFAELKKRIESLDKTNNKDDLVSKSQDLMATYYNIDKLLEEKQQFILFKEQTTYGYMLQIENCKSCIESLLFNVMHQKKLAEQQEELAKTSINTLFTYNGINTKYITSNKRPITSKTKIISKPPKIDDIEESLFSESNSCLKDFLDDFK